MTSLAISGTAPLPTFQLSPTSNETPDLSTGEVSTTSQPPVDELLLGGIDADPSFSLIRESTRLRSHTQLRVDDDGSVRLRSRTHLRYSYEFLSDDGTKIKIKARAKLNYSAQVDADGDVKIRAKVKFQVSLLQESVNSEAGSLLGSGFGDGLIAGLADALTAFNDLVDEATSQFLSGENLNGDGLITDLVSAFNALIESLVSPADEAATDTPAVVESLPEPGSLPPIENTPTAEPAENPLLAEGVASPIADADQLPPADVPTETPIEAPTGEVSTEPVDEPVADVEESPADVEEPAALAETFDYQSLRLKLRFQFTQSLTQLVQAFDGGDEEPQTLTLTRFHYEFSAKLALSARYEAGDGGEPEFPALDASA